MENGRQSGLVFGAVFKTVRRLLKSLVCSIRTVFRHAPPIRTVRFIHYPTQKPKPFFVFVSSIYTVSVGHRDRLSARIDTP
jgi:hypothetical protein